MADEDRDTGTTGAPDWEALARYLAGESDPAERERVERAVAADPARQALVRALGDTVRRPAPAALTEAEVEMALRAVMGRRSADATAVPLASRELRAPRWGGRRASAAWRSTVGLRAAAGVLLVAGAALVWRSASMNRLGGTSGTSAATPAARRIVTAVGAVDSLDLPDGTRAVLGPRSTLSIPTGYGVASRTLVLRGQGYFDVRHDASRPFVVHTMAGELVDVGTRFAVESSDSAELRVVVLGGVVAVRPRRAARADTLRARDRGALSTDGVLVVERQAATGAEDAAWMTRRLVLRDASVARVTAELARWYGLELRVTDSVLRSRRLTASFEGASHEEIARVLAATLGGAARLSGDTLWLAAPGGGRPTP